jgi:hypothetical protein
MLHGIYINDDGDRDFMLPGVYLAREPSAAPTGRLKVWTGSAWTLKPVKVWMGAAWVEKPVKVWNGSAWV